jgi:ribosomal protein S18 acetylase RimI-like enzyme
MDSILRINSSEALSSFEEEFTNILSRAFYNDPFYVWIMPNHKKRIRQLEWWMKILLKYTLIYGDIHYTKDRKAVAMWLGPDHPMVNDFKIFSMGLILYPFKIGFKNFMRALDVSGQWDKEHKKMNRRHYYLMVIAVEPEWQGKGIGSRLMQVGLKRADDEGLECFLETVTPEDVRFYMKHNFDIIFNKKFGIDDQYWLMTRNPLNKNNEARNVKT